MRLPRRAERTPVLMVLFVVMALIAGLSAATAKAAPAANAGVHPNKVGGLDCNELQRGPASGQARPPVRRPARVRRGAVRGQRPLHRARRAVRPLPLQPARSGSNVLAERDACRSSRGPCRQSTTRRDVTHRFELTVAPWTSNDRLRSQVRADAACSRIRSTRRTATIPARARRSWSYSSTRQDSPPSPTASAATTRTGARRSPSTAWSARPPGPVTQLRRAVNFASSRPTASPPVRPARS